ncbi:MAG TPA: FecR domain-containing protein [Planctomycetota bacterium]|nr:FecR domain-containing protein [Planctomycetota bacterium]
MSPASTPAPSDAADSPRELMLRYIAGELKDFEIERLEQALRNDAALRREMAELMLQAVHLAEGPAQAVKVSTRLPAAPRRSARTSLSVRRRAQEAWAIHPGIAAGVALAVLVGIILLLSGKPTERAQSNPEKPKTTPPDSIAEAEARRLHAQRLAQLEAEHAAAAKRLAEVEKQRANLQAQPLASPTSEEQRQREASLAALDQQRQSIEAELQAARERREMAEVQNRKTAEMPEIAIAPVPLQPQPQPGIRPDPASNAAIARIIFVASETAPVTRIRGAVREKLTTGVTLQAGDVISVGARPGAVPVAQAALALFSGSTIDLAEGTEIEIVSERVLRLKQGLLYADVEKDTSRSPADKKEYALTLHTAAATVGVTGTQFDLRSDGRQASVQMEEGVVNFFNDRGSRSVAAGQGSSCRAGQAPDAPAALDPVKLWRGRKGPLAPAGTAQLSISGLSLLNADTGKVIDGFDPIAEGATINLSTLPSRNLNILIRTRPEVVGSLKIEINGVPNKSPENAPPYAVFGDDFKGNFTAWRPNAGKYSIRVTPYTGKSYAGEAGTAFTLNFQVVEKR